MVLRCAIVIYLLMPPFHAFFDAFSQRLFRFLHWLLRLFSMPLSFSFAASWLRWYCFDAIIIDILLPSLMRFLRFTAVEAGEDYFVWVSLFIMFSAIISSFFDFDEAIFDIFFAMLMIHIFFHYAMIFLHYTTPLIISIASMLCRRLFSWIISIFRCGFIFLRLHFWLIISCHFFDDGR